MFIDDFIFILVITAGNTQTNGDMYIYGNLVKK